MTDQDFTKQLEELNVPDINASKQTALLKAVLIRRHEKTLGLSGVLNYIKQGYKQMSLLKKMSPIAAIIVVAVVFGLLNQSTPVSAQATVDKAMMRAGKLSPEQRANIEAKIKADLNKSLEEAKAASDLKIESGAPEAVGFGRITAPFGKIKDAFKFESKAEGDLKAGRAFSITSSDGAPVSENIKYMTYTNPEGQKVTLGVDENDMVVFKMIQLTEEQKQKLMETRKQIHDEQGFNVKMEGPGSDAFQISAPPTDILTAPVNE
jgi:hypothetical protein